MSDDTKASIIIVLIPFLMGLVVGYSFGKSERPR